jgi:hypothetical protein
MKQQVLERFIMVTGFERNLLYFLFTAAQEFHFPSGAALNNDKTIHTSFIISFLQNLPQNPISSIIETNQNLALQKRVSRLLTTQ